MTVDIQPGTLSDRVAEEIRALLGRRRISQAELARRLHVTGTWLNYRLTGRQEIGLNDLAIIAAALQVKPSDLLGGGSADTVRYPQHREKQQVKRPRNRPDGRTEDDRPPSRPRIRRPTLLHRKANG